MGSLWGLALPLFFCYLEARGSRSSSEMSASSGSAAVTEMSMVETVTGRNLTEAIFNALCTESSSEEAQVITIDILTLAHTSIEAEALALEGSTSPDTPVPAIGTSQAQTPEIIAPAKALVAYSITNVELTNCSITEIETTAFVSGTPGTAHSPTEGVEDLSTAEALVLPDSAEATSHITKMTTSVETFVTASTMESTSPDTTAETPLTTSSTTGREMTAKAPTPNGSVGTVHLQPLEETSALSVEAASHVKVAGALTISTEAGSTMGKATSPAGSSALVSPSEVATIKNSTSSETFTTDSTTNAPFPISKGPLPSVHLTTAYSSQGTSITLAKTTASAKTLMAANTARGKPPTASHTTAWTRQTTRITAGEDEGFLLLRLSVATQEDLSDPRVAERLMRQLRRELHAHLPPIQVSLLHVRQV
ncbi:mucin-20 [Choloepus didactylus]|uniref:mucin-20 n=1 Tax=Choloepus didactylus TaxID=27675 RepID=UPI0018A105E2|nr:mucin-20 [Choloepus didactylus]